MSEVCDVSGRMERLVAMGAEFLVTCFQAFIGLQARGY